MVQGVGPTVCHRLLQLNVARSPTPMTDWVANSSATNHTTPYSGHIYSPRPLSIAHPFSIVVGNCSVLSDTLVGDSMLFESFYVNDVLVAPDLSQNLLFICHYG
jgi:hypothetical protein